MRKHKSIKPRQVSQMQRKLGLSLPAEVIEVFKGHYSCPPASALCLTLGLPSGPTHPTDRTRWAQQKTTSQATNEWQGLSKWLHLPLKDFSPAYHFRPLLFSMPFELDFAPWCKCIKWMQGHCIHWTRLAEGARYSSMSHLLQNILSVCPWGLSSLSAQTQCDRPPLGLTS